MRNYLLRLMHSPRWQFLRRWIGPYLVNGGPDEQWLRVVLKRETEALLRGLNPGHLSALEISGNAWNQPDLFGEHRSVEYPEYDVCTGVLDDRFDVIIAEQVFEHLLWPYRAGKNVYEMLNPNGYFFVSTPFMIRIHNHPVDCSRWTEIGLKHLLAECGFPLDKVKTGSWGNQACVKANLKRWQIYQQWRHSLKNEPDFPVVVWALAQK
jgi:hypothetical protein